MAASPLHGYRPAYLARPSSFGDHTLTVITTEAA
jgi:hypothetical protein